MIWQNFIENIFQERALENYLVDEVSGQKVTYAGFRELVLDLATGILKTGIRRGERVAITCPSSIDFIVAYFACLYSGVVAVPVNPNLTETDFDTLLQQCNPSLIIHSDENSLVWKSFKNEQLILRQRVFRFSQLYDMGKNGHGRIGSFLGFSNDQMWTIHFTSGTTGTSKGVCHTPASLFASACSFSKALGFHSSLNMYHVLPMHYMAGFLNTVLCPFVSGGAVLISRPFGPGSALNFWQNPKAYSVNVLWLVPSMLVALLKLDRDEGIRDWVRKSIKMVCVGTAPLAEPVKKDFEMKYGIPVLQSYGLSETLFVSSNTLHSPRSDGSVGVLLDGVQVKICDNVGGEFMSETNGEILIRSNGMMVGYWNSKLECPVAELKDGWFQSGDIGWVNSNGELFITGRIKDIIIKGGENISPKKVADALMLHPDIEEAVVVGVPHDFYGEEVAAALRLKPGLCLSDREASIRQHCIGCLPPIAVPKIFRQFDEFPRGSTGKILNREIKRFF